MTQFKKTKLAAAVLAATVAAPASAVTWQAGDWEVSYTGFVNLFYNQIDNDATGGADSAHLNEGLLPNFHTMKAVSPTIGGLTGTSQITFAVDSSSSKAVDQAKGGSSIDMREVFFNVGGSFGTISAGRTLSLFQRQAILQDMTLFGVGANGALDGGGTSLGRIAYGYVYPEFNTRFTWKSPDINGFNIELGVFDPTENTTAAFETDTPQFQTEATYNTSYAGGSLNVWAGALWQEMEHIASGSDVESFGYNVGGAINFGGFSLTGSYYDGEAIGVVRTLDAFGGNSFVCSATACTEADNDGYYLQGTYTFAGKTKVGLSYGESTQDADAAGNFAESNELVTFGVYHDVNSWLKVVAEYNAQNGHVKTDTFSIGGFMFW